MQIKTLNEYLKKFLEYEYTEEPDAFELQTENQLNRELENEIDNQYKNNEKLQNKYVIKMKFILDSLKQKLHIDYLYSERNKAFKVFFNNKIDYNKFMAQEKDSKNFNACLKLEIDKQKPFEELNREGGERYLLLFVK